MDFDPTYIYIGKFRGEVQWYMIENKDFISSIGFKLKKKKWKNSIINGQSLTF